MYYLNTGLTIFESNILTVVLRVILTLTPLLLWQRTALYQWDSVLFYTSIILWQHTIFHFSTFVTAYYFTPLYYFATVLICYSTTLLLSKINKVFILIYCSTTLSKHYTTKSNTILHFCFLNRTVQYYCFTGRYRSFWD